MKQLIGLDTTDTPNDAFSRITLGNKRYGINLYVKFQNGAPASGVTITSSGSPPISGSMVTDSNGYLFLAQDDASFTASIDNAGGKVYVDCVENPSVSQTPSDTITTVNMTWGQNNNVITVDSSKTITISPIATYVDVCAIGGGGSGMNRDSRNYGGSGGGGGGYTKTGTMNPGGQNISVTIGSGGRAVTVERESSPSIYSSGIAGGATSIVGSFGTITANGGNPGSCMCGRTNSPSGIKGGDGGSGGGGACFGTDVTRYAGNGGSNGSNGYSNGTNLQTPTGQNFGGTGQGTSTTFDGMTFSAGGSGYAIFKWTT